MSRERAVLQTFWHVDPTQAVLVQDKRRITWNRIEAFGANRIAWGSNFPATADTLAGILGKAQAAFATASAEQRSWIFGRTAQRLYPSLDD